jgi:hypothetical protein
MPSESTPSSASNGPPAPDSSTLNLHVGMVLDQDVVDDREVLLLRSGTLITALDAGRPAAGAAHGTCAVPGELPQGAAAPPIHPPRGASTRS